MMRYIREKSRVRNNNKINMRGGETDKKKVQRGNMGKFHLIT